MKRSLYFPTVPTILLFLLVVNILYQNNHRKKMEKLYIELIELSYKSGYLDSIEYYPYNVDKDLLVILLDVRAKNFIKNCIFVKDDKQSAKNAQY